MKNICIPILILLFCLTATFRLYAQQQIITGQISDNDDSGPLVGVNVVEVDRNGRYLNGTVTDINGNYIIRVSTAGATLQVSMLGYERQVIEIGSQTRIDIALKQEVTQLGEARIVGQKMGNDGVLAIRDRATSIARIEFNELQSSMTTTVEEMLQGRLGNVDIISVSGDPGAGLNIRIRGTATLNARNSPLIVVNGIPYDTQIDQGFDFASADIERFGNLIDVAPEDIESIEVLKDAGSTAIWGSRAANGVLMIKTKRGLKSKPIFDYTFKLTRAHEARSIPMLSGGDYAKLIGESHFNTKNRNNFISTPEAREIAFDKNWEEYWNYAQNTNWVDEITRVALTHQHNFSVRGGGEKSAYGLSVGYQDEKGTTIGTRLQKINMRTSFDYNISTKLRFNSDILFTRYDQDATYDFEDSYYKNEKSLRSMAYRRMPNLSVYQRDTTNRVYDQYFTPQSTLAGNSKELVNPVAFANKATHKRYRDNARAGFNLNYSMLPQLVLNSSVTLDIFDNKFNKFLPYEALGYSLTDEFTNRSTKEFSKKTSVQNMTKVIYKPDLGEQHDLNVLGQFDTEISVNSTRVSVTNRSASPELQGTTGDGKTLLLLDESQSDYRMFGFFVSGFYKYLDRYIFSLGIKREGNSKFSPESRWGNFPTATFAWRISEEPFLKSFNFIDDLRLRGSWGKSGNAPDDNYLYFQTYKAGMNLGYLEESGVVPAGMELTSLKWETIEQINLGLSLYGLKNRLNVEFDIYEKTTHNLYIKDAIAPEISGFSKFNLNDGELKNRGLELSVDYKYLDRENYSASVMFNFSHNQNIVIRLPRNFSTEYGDMLDNGDYRISIVPGKPMGGFWGYEFEGVYASEEDTWVRDINDNLIYETGSDVPMTMMFGGPTVYFFEPGDARYRDRNFDGKIDEQDMIFLGDNNPKFMGGFNPRFQYKSLTANLFFYYRIGQKIINQTRMDMEKMYNYDNQSIATNWRWRREGDQTDMPRALYNEGYNWLGSDRFVEDGSFVRLKTVSLSYNFPKQLVNQYGLADLKVYLTGYNLFTWTRYTGQDPEVSLTSRPDVLSKDHSRTPPSVRYMVGVNITF